MGQTEARDHLLLIAPHNSYRTLPFVDAAHRLDIDVLVASEGRHSIVSEYADGLHIDMHDAAAALATILRAAEKRPFGAVLGTDDATAELAAVVAANLALPHNPPEAARYARRKDLGRERLAREGINVPRHRCIDLQAPLSPQAEEIRFPCVLKPLSLSASRGVIRADNVHEFLQACARIERLLHNEDVQERNLLLAEDFVPGVEVAVEGVLDDGEFHVIAIFDKPEPLDGPYFEETYYITPSRLVKSIQTQLRREIAKACRAYGLREGPIHAECRINSEGVWILEVAARTIGGLCGRLFRYGVGYGLEELVLAQALGHSLSVNVERRGAGVLMIPVPQAGILRRVEGVMTAQRVPYIDEVVIQLREGYELVPWPEGSSYLGFIFARAPTPALAEAALRQAHRCLNIVVAPLWKLSPQPAATRTASHSLSRVG
ncbi:MAG: ATP-grasp domain-containing protein [Acidiferrobacterales bacterium]|nr:ATP-grasp domain-containing protein [Acidiferrobacterales bacterium]